MNAQQFILMFWILTGYAIFMSIIVFVSFAWTPVATFLKARLTGGVILMEKLKGMRAIDFKVGKYFGKSAIKQKGSRYFISPESGVLIKKGKIPMFLTASNVASTVNVEFQAILDLLTKEYGSPIDTQEKYREALSLYAELHPSKKIRVPAYHTFKMQDIDSLFNLNVNVDSLESTISLEKRKASMLEKFGMAQAMPLFIVLLGAGLAAVFIKMAFGGDGCPDCNCIYEGVRNATQIAGMGVGYG